MTQAGEDEGTSSDSLEEEDVKPHLKNGYKGFRWLLYAMLSGDLELQVPHD